MEKWTKLATRQRKLAKTNNYQASQESVNERKAVKETFKIAASLESNIRYHLLIRFNLKKTLRIL